MCGDYLAVDIFLLKFIKDMQNILILYIKML
jgi:hypothetical protein